MSRRPPIRRQFNVGSTSPVLIPSTSPAYPRRTQRSWSAHLAGYLLASTPVTQATYEAVTGQRPSTSRGDRLPVEGVSWWEAVRKVGACRGGVAARLPGWATGARYGELDDIDWHRSKQGKERLSRPRCRSSMPTQAQCPVGFWTFQLLESGIILGLAASTLGLAFVALRRSSPDGRL